VALLLALAFASTLRAGTKGDSDARADGVEAGAAEEGATATSVLSGLGPVTVGSEVGALGLQANDQALAISKATSGRFMTLTVATSMQVNRSNCTESSELDGVQ
jgi:hypothetical protein